MQRYQVDLDEMDLALRQLYGVIRRLEEAELKARYRTGLARDSLGTGFEEAYDFYAGQALVKTHLEDVAAHLRVFAEEVARKMKWTRDAYDDAEY
ncbi:hypothetical protein [Streptomyces sp. RP5T]|uniref:hypothetical protein n=1 Tax=Streptomyces sp. RP5T TaxID=2490848 RepID=UPI000F645456|nr:hypothetical protein [Streptomyces sp. RP5T]RRR85388.1 hypothetical protein EHS43_08385 [Streptomyces sp. RP5T]